MKVTLARRVCDAVENGADAGEAARTGIEMLARRVNGLGGVICLDKNGKVGHFFNMPRLAVASIGPDGGERVKV